VRAIGTPDAGPGLRQGLEALEHSAVAVRGMFRAVHDAISDPGWPEGEVAEDVVQGLAQVFLELASGLAAFGALVRAESLPKGRDVPGQVAEVKAALDGLHEARARMNELLLIDTAPVLSELHTAVLTAVKRLLVELSLDERMRREMRLWRSRRPLVHRAPPPG
jgi:hypothetical protein